MEKDVCVVCGKELVGETGLTGMLDGKMEGEWIPLCERHILTGMRAVQRHLKLVCEKRGETQVRKAEKDAIRAQGKAIVDAAKLAAKALLAKPKKGAPVEAEVDAQ